MHVFGSHCNSTMLSDLCLEEVLKFIFVLFSLWEGLNSPSYPGRIIMTANLKKKILVITIQCTCFCPEIMFCVLTDGNHLIMNSEKVSSNLQKFQQFWTMGL